MWRHSCVCSVIDHRWRQNVKKQWSGTRAAGECVTDVFNHILTSSVIFAEQTYNKESIFLYNDQKRKSTDTYLLRTAWLFEDLS